MCRFVWAIVYHLPFIIISALLFYAIDGINIIGLPVTVITFICIGYPKPNANVSFVVAFWSVVVVSILAVVVGSFLLRIIWIGVEPPIFRQPAQLDPQSDLQYFTRRDASVRLQISALRATRRTKSAPN